MPCLYFSAQKDVRGSHGWSVALSGALSDFKSAGWVLAIGYEPVLCGAHQQTTLGQCSSTCWTVPNNNTSCTSIIINSNDAVQGTGISGEESDSGYRKNGHSKKWPHLIWTVGSDVIIFLVGKLHESQH